MQPTEFELRQQIVEIGRLMYSKGWVAANDGNISARIAPDRILATPTQVSKGRLKEDDLIICDLEGRKIAGHRDCTSEILMHLTVYAMRPDVQAVVHAHPPVATGFAVAGRALDHALIPEVIINLGAIPLAEYGLPGTPELSDKLKPYIPSHDALLMANHGAVTYGADLDRAFFHMETLEHFARIALVAELLGGAKALPSEEVSKLCDARRRYGCPDRNGVEPVAAEHSDRTGSGRYVTYEDLAALLGDAAVRTRGNS